MGSVTVFDGVASLVPGSNEAMIVSPTLVEAELRLQTAFALTDNVSGCSSEGVMRH